MDNIQLWRNASFEEIGQHIKDQIEHNMVFVDLSKFFDLPSNCIVFSQYAKEFNICSDESLKIKDCTIFPLSKNYFTVDITRAIRVAKDLEEQRLEAEKVINKHKEVVTAGKKLNHIIQYYADELRDWGIVGAKLKKHLPDVNGHMAYSVTLDVDGSKLHDYYVLLGQFLHEDLFKVRGDRCFEIISKLLEDGQKEKFDYWSRIYETISVYTTRFIEFDIIDGGIHFVDYGNLKDDTRYIAALLDGDNNMKFDSIDELKAALMLVAW